MKKLQEIDKNFVVNTDFEREDLIFHNVKEEPFAIYGAYKPFVRLPQDIAVKTNQGVAELYKNTAGIRVRFATDSPYTAIYARVSKSTPVPHMAFSGTSGFDMYEYLHGSYKYLKTFIPSIDDNVNFGGVYDFREGDVHDLTVNFPLYNSVDELYIGIKKGSLLMPGGNYNNKKPIVFYGSSITQGGCASRPGTCYPAMLSRRFNLDYINLGFSGSAFGEEIIADYISGIDMSLFVFDYDHNAPNADHLRKTHENMYHIIRKKNPALPIIMLSMPFTDCINDSAERENVIIDTYNNALRNGDKNIYFIKGSTAESMFGGNDGTVDGCHPNDIGFMCMAEKISQVFQEIFKLKIVPK